MAARNAQDYVAASVQSILGQTLQDLEIIVVNDASTDGTGDVLRRLEAADPRVIVFDHDERKGIATTRNEAIAVARAPYLAIQDADDLADPKRLERQAAFLDAHPATAVVGGAIEVVGPDLRPMGVRRYPTTDASLRSVIYFFSPLAQPAAMIRKSSLDQVGGYDPRFPPAEDLDLWFRLGRVGELANLPEIVTRYRVWPGSSVAQQLRRTEKLTLQIRRRHRHNSAFRFTLGARFYQWFHFASLWLVPSRFKQWLFFRLRDSREGVHG